MLAVWLDDDVGVLALAPALRALRAARPADPVLLTTPGAARFARAGRLSAEIVEWPEAAGEDAAWTRSAAPLVDALASRGFGCAVVFTAPGRSPHPGAYIAFLAGIPVRVGASAEFGGRLLTTEVRDPLPAGTDRHLALLEAAGLPASARDVPVRSGTDEAERGGDPAPARER